jgi:NAD(P)H dehydrogenase (quinone)
MHAPPFTPKYPIVTPDDLKELDGIIWGFPTRYGGAPAQVRAFFDYTGGVSPPGEFSPMVLGGGRKGF